MTPELKTCLNYCDRTPYLPTLRGLIVNAVSAEVAMKDIRIVELEQQVKTLEEYMLKGVAFRDELQARLCVVTDALTLIEHATDPNSFDDGGGHENAYDIAHEALAGPPRICPHAAEAKLFRERYELEQIRYEGISEANEELREEAKRLREAVEWGCSVALDTGRLLKDEFPYRGHRASWLHLAAELRRLSSPAPSIARRKG